MNLPVHSGGLGIVNLDSIHPEIAFPGIGILGVNTGQRDEASAVVRPTLEDRQIEQSGQCFGGFGSGNRFFETMYDLLTRAGFDMPGFGVEQVESLQCKIPR